VNGLLPPGSQLVELRLAEQFVVSRGPLREAIRQLVEEGFLVTVPHTGTSVINLTVADVREIYSLHTTIETFPARLTWGRRTREFRRETVRRNNALAAAINEGASFAAMNAELKVHGWFTNGRDTDSSKKSGVPFSGATSPCLTWGNRQQAARL
jgi:DNA-binding GntR family transcriptional regulator